ncbi:hypothetical protein WJX74_005453 [Apatococcus lobatus]|uniref:Pseudouridine synthase RsuA/RluA-like domain-containing protein n=1 Tax=Apatococcus lobatus TaxID=904363 RepID=A0AAW1SBH4_9CHLO
MQASPRLYSRRYSCKSHLASLSWQDIRSKPRQQQQQQQLQLYYSSGQNSAKIFSRRPAASIKLEALTHDPQQSSSALQQTLQAVALPPDLIPALGPRVEHIIARDAGTLSAVLSSQLQLPEHFTKELVRFGAVHWSAVLPALSEARLASMDAVKIREAKEARQHALQILTKQQASQPMQRARKDVAVNQWAYIRVHLHPKRFPAVYHIFWRERIVNFSKQWVVLDKPAGVPAVPTVDNILENCLACAARAVHALDSMHEGSEGDLPHLLITHRLDVWTSGILVLGRTPAFVAAFNRLLQAHSLGHSSGSGAGGGVRKLYRALSRRSPPEGLMEHHVITNHLVNGQPVRTQMFAEPGPATRPCFLTVQSRRQVMLNPVAAEAFGFSEAWESEVELGTGRTHQIRAQFAAAGCPLAGDLLYAPGPAEPFQSQPASSVNAGSSQEARHRAASEGSGTVPEEPIGLQAWRLEDEMTVMLDRLLAESQQINILVDKSLSKDTPVTPFHSRAAPGSLVGCVGSNLPAEFVLSQPGCSMIILHANQALVLVSFCGSFAAHSKEAAGIRNAEGMG